MSLVLHRQVLYVIDFIWLTHLELAGKDDQDVAWTSESARNPIAIDDIPYRFSHFEKKRITISESFETFH